MEEKRIKIAIDIILERSGKILLGKRLNAIGAGLYGVPGGHLELGESIQAGMERELKEETGIVPKKLDLISIIDQPETFDRSHYIHFLFHCTEFNGEPENKEPDRCEGWEWFDINYLPENMFIPHKDFVPAMISKKLLYYK